MIRLMSVPLLVAFFCLASFGVNAATPVSVSGREYTETMLLLSDKDFDVRLAAKSLNRKNTKNEVIFDVLAEIAWSACSGKRKMNPDTLAWLAKSIGNTLDGRYASLVDDCLTKLTEKAPIKYFTEAKTALAGSTTTNPFVGGKLDLDKFRDDLVKNRKKNPPETMIRTLFEELKAEQPLNDVYAKLGAPEKIKGINVPRGKVGFMHVKVKMSDDRIVLGYPGLGELTFGYDTTDGNWLLVNAKSSGNLQWLEREGRFATKMDVVSNGDARDLRQLTTTLLKQKNSLDTAILDRVADRIYHSQTETDGHMADVLAHMSKLLRNSKNGKYKQLLQDVSEKAAHATLRKHAGLAANALPDSTGENYVPKKIGN